MEIKEGADKYDFAFSNFNKKELYKMFIDKVRLANPKPDEIDQNSKQKYLFDRGSRAEPGYYKGMKEAFGLMRTKIGDKITIEMLIELHDTAVGQVTHMKKGTAGAFFVFPFEQIDPKALKELVDSGIVFSLKEIFENLSNGRYIVARNCNSFFLAEIKNYYLSQATEIGNGKLKFANNSMDKLDDIKNRITPYISHYYGQIEKVETIKGKIAAIAELIRALEVAHFFPDGNQRTYAFLLMNKLLIENNIPPAILDEPGMFDAWCSLENMANEIYQGIVNFLNNDFEKQRQFLKEQCQSFTKTVPKDYLQSYDYYPFFEIGFGTEREKWIKAEVEREIKIAIENGDIENLDDRDNLKPLSKAIMIGNDDLIDKLLQFGAKPYCPENFIKSPFLTALIHYNPKTVEKLSSLINFDQVSPHFILVLSQLKFSNGHRLRADIEERITDLLFKLNRGIITIDF